MENCSAKIQELIVASSHLPVELPTFSSVGGYPLFYVDAHNNVLCPDCANENDEFSEELTDYDVNYEDPALYCDHCSCRIESAYAEDDADCPAGKIDHSCKDCCAVMINGVFCHETGCPSALQTEAYEEYD